MTFISRRELLKRAVFHVVPNMNPDGTLNVFCSMWSRYAAIFWTAAVVGASSCLSVRRRFPYARIAWISWGLVTCVTLAVVGVWTFYGARILLGIAEAGFFPGIVYFLTFWFPARERARAAWTQSGSA